MGYRSNGFVEKRLYREYGCVRAAGMIASEVVTESESVGWAGSLEELDEVRGHLAPFGIRYTDDMLGMWERVAS